MAFTRRQKFARWYHYWIGRKRLAWGFCPQCNSSPPQTQCRICSGEHRYGWELSPYRKLSWLHRWNNLFNMPYWKGSKRLIRKKNKR